MQLISKASPHFWGLVLLSLYFLFTVKAAEAEPGLHFKSGSRPVSTNDGPQWPLVFPCTPDAIREPVTIILSSEMHGTAFSKVQLNKFFEAAKSGSEALVLEHTLEAQVKADKNFPDVAFKKNADGDLAWSFFALHKTRWSLKSNPVAYVKLLDLLAAEPFNETLKAIQRPLLNQKNEQLLKDVEEARAVLSKKSRPSESLLARAQTEFSAKEAIVALDLIYHHHLQRLEQMPQSNQLVDVKALKNVAGTTPGIRAWRDRNLAVSAAEAACAKGPRTIRLHMGIAHTPGVYAELKQMISRSGLEEKVKLEIDRSVFSDPAEAKVLASSDKDYVKEYTDAKAALLKIAPK